MVITEALGHALVVEPYVDTVVVAGGLLHRAGGEQAASLLEKIVAGTAIVALAAEEPESGDRWQDVTTTAQRDGDGWILHGRKTVAMSAPLATPPVGHREHPGRRLALPRRSRLGRTGLSLTGYRTIDDRRAADLVLDGLRLPAGALLGEDGQAWPSLEQARDEGAAAVCSEAVGCMRKVLADTVEYCKQRQQFGLPIGSFQVLQHRMVDMYIELEQAVAAVLLAVLHLEDEPRRARAVGVGREGDGRPGRPLHRPAGRPAARRNGHDRGTGHRPLLQAADGDAVRVRLHRPPHRAVCAADQTVAAGS